MRDILFRGKARHSSEWITGYYAYFEPCIGHPNPYDAIIPAIGTSAAVEIEPATLGQYTGLVDINGKQIFEGDIVTIPGSKKQGLPAYIAWSKKAVRFEIQRIGYVPLSLDPLLYGERGWFSRCEVIGNIHDDPGLIRGASYE